MSQPGELLVPLVGAHFRPPAKQVLQCLPAGARLGLVPEPENAYDSKAIKVTVACEAEVPSRQYDNLRALLEGTGTELEELIGGGTVAPDLQLGYIADSDGKQLSASRLPGNREVGQMMAAGLVEATLAFGADGKPQVRVRPAQAEDEDDGDEGEPEDLMDDEGDDWPDGEDEE